LKTIIVALLFLLSGCVSTPALISGTSPGEAVPITNRTVVTDLQAAAYNLDNAVLVGALPADDPAPKCIHDILVKAGIELPPGVSPPQSFKPKNDGVASLGAIAYILAQQAKQIASSGAFKTDAVCEAVLGRVVIDGMKAVNNAIPLIPGIPRIP
jgi:hypothetical protein